MDLSVSSGYPIRLTGNALKIIAAISMLIDHIGYLLLPQVHFLRLIGRIAYPIFAFMIAEGCRYTKNKLRYFAGIFVLAMLCQAVYFVAVKEFEFSILVTFSLSIILIYSWQNCQKAFAGEALPQKVIAVALLVTLIVGIYALNKILYIDYGFWGSMVPLFASVFMGANNKWDRISVHVSMLGIGLLLLCMDSGSTQLWCVMALPLLYLYSGKRGKWNLKYFFYIFYPAHLVLLQGIYMLFQ